MFFPRVPAALHAWSSFTGAQCLQLLAPCLGGLARTPVRQVLQAWRQLRRSNDAHHVIATFLTHSQFVSEWGLRRGGHMVDRP